MIKESTNRPIADATRTTFVTPWSISVKEEYLHGGQEVNVAFCELEIDDVLNEDV